MREHRGRVSEKMAAPRLQAGHCYCVTGRQKKLPLTLLLEMMDQDDPSVKVMPRPLAFNNLLFGIHDLFVAAG